MQVLICGLPRMSSEWLGKCHNPSRSTVPRQNADDCGRKMLVCGGFWRSTTSWFRQVKQRCGLLPNPSKYCLRRRGRNEPERESLCSGAFSAGGKMSTHDDGRAQTSVQ